MIKGIIGFIIGFFCCMIFVAIYDSIRPYQKHVGTKIYVSLPGDYWQRKWYKVDVDTVYTITKEIVVKEQE